METEQQVRQFVGDLGQSVWAFSTLAAAVESGLLEALTEPRGAGELGARAEDTARAVSADAGRPRRAGAGTAGG